MFNRLLYSVAKLIIYGVDFKLAGNIRMVRIHRRHINLRLHLLIKFAVNPFKPLFK